MSEYSIERLDQNNLKHLITLYKNAFNASVPLEFLQKKYDTSKLGSQYIGFIAYAPDRTPAAYYGVFPCYIEYKKQIVPAAQSGDTMTHSAHRGKGLFLSLARQTYQLAKENGIKFIFGFPNKNSYPGFVGKLNWTHKENIKTYDFPVSTFPLAKIVKKIPLLAPLYRGYVSFVLSSSRSSLSSFSNSVVDDQYGGVLRDTDYFSYKRYTSNNILELHGIQVWIKVDGYFFIGDIERTSPEGLEKIIKKLRKIAFILGCDKMIFNLSPGVNNDLLLSKKHFAKEGLPIGYLDLDSGLDLDKIKYTGGDFDTF